MPVKAGHIFIFKAKSKLHVYALQHIFNVFSLRSNFSVAKFFTSLEGDLATKA